jgi:hypothetical protein
MGRTIDRALRVAGVFLIGASWRHAASIGVVSVDGRYSSMRRRFGRDAADKPEQILALVGGWSGWLPTLRLETGRGLSAAHFICNCGDDRTGF